MSQQNLQNVITEIEVAVNALSNVAQTLQNIEQNDDNTIIQNGGLSSIGNVLTNLRNTIACAIKTKADPCEQSKPVLVPSVIPASVPVPSSAEVAAPITPTKSPANPELTGGYFFNTEESTEIDYLSEISVEDMNSNDDIDNTIVLPSLE